MTVAVPTEPASRFAADLLAAFEAGRDARRDNVQKRACWERYEDPDTRHAWRVGWDSADAELREDA